MGEAKAATIRQLVIEHGQNGPGERNYDEVCDLREALVKRYGDSFTDYWKFSATLYSALKSKV